MGQRMKWLDDERYIRIAGALLLASPFFNFFLSIATNNSIPNKWDPAQMWAIFMAATTLQWILRVSKVVVGYLMFRGKSSAWVPVLAILGVTIFLNFLTFKKDIQVSMTQAVLSILINVVLFLIVFRAEFRLNQEVEKKLKAVRLAKAEAAKKIAAQPAPVDSPSFSFAKPEVVTALEKPATIEKPKFTKAKIDTVKADTVVPITAARTAPRNKKRVKVKEFLVARGTVIEFEGIGHIAKVIRCHNDEIWLQGTRELPKDLDKRSVILDSADRKSSVRLKYNRTQDDQYWVFKIG